MTLLADDRGLLLGDGLFETLLWKDGALVDAEAHAARLIRGCAVLGLPAPRAEGFIRAAEEAAAAASVAAGRLAVRLTWTAGSGGRGLDRPAQPRCRLFAAARPAPAFRGPARLATAGVRRNDGSPSARLKTLAYVDNVLARAEARDAGADEALMLNTQGHVACAAAANIFWFEGDRLVTPALDCGVLDGIARGRVLEAAVRLGVAAALPAAERSRLDNARGLFLTNSLIGLRPVGWLDGQEVEPHPMTARLAEAARL